MDSMFTKRHFIAIAAVLKRNKPNGTTGKYKQWALDVRSFARIFTELNENFNQDKFLKACGFN